MQGSSASLLEPGSRSACPAGVRRLGLVQRPDDAGNKTSAGPTCAQLLHTPCRHTRQRARLRAAPPPPRCPCARSPRRCPTNGREDSGGLIQAEAAGPNRERVLTMPPATSQATWPRRARRGAASKQLSTTSTMMTAAHPLAASGGDFPVLSATQTPSANSARFLALSPLISAIIRLSLSSHLDLWAILCLIPLTAPSLPPACTTRTTSMRVSTARPRGSRPASASAIWRIGRI